MRTIRSIFVGLVAALIASIVWVIAEIAFAMGLDMWHSMQMGGGGVSGFSVAIPSVPMLFCGAVGFVTGFRWDRHRGRRTRSQA